MSKSYKKKIRLHIAYGNNTEFYRSRRRRERRVNKNTLREAVNQYDFDDMDDVQFLEIPKRNDWEEPTDGSYVVDHNIINREIIDRNYDKNYLSWIKKSCRNLKWFNKILNVG
jgi:hypothetical protein